MEVIEFNVKYSCQAYSTNKVRGTTASSTSSARGAAERLAEKVFPKQHTVVVKLHDISDTLQRWQVSASSLQGR